VKKAVIIFNPNSGNKRFKLDDVIRCETILKNYGYESATYVTRYKSHASEIIESLEEVDLVLSIGGDGTFNEVMSGNLKRKKRLVLSHLPVGTTNDIGAMFGLGKDIEKNLKLILNGTVKEIDICSVNNRIFVYVAGFGKFMNVPYETPRKMKKRIGYFAYLIEAAKYFLQKTSLYECTYEVNGEKYHGLYSFALISNANRIAGINNFYKDVKLNDNTFEVLLCNLEKKKDIVKSLLYLKTNDITKVPGFYFHKTNHFKIEFKEKLKKPWCIDGEELDINTKKYEISIIRNIKMMIPTKNIDKLFIEEQEEVPKKKSKAKKTQTKKKDQEKDELSKRTRKNTKK